MADFCEQCTKALYPDEDVTNDFVNLQNYPPLKQGEGFVVICEGCGPTMVNNAGVCIDPTCFKKHGA